MALDGDVLLWPGFTLDDGRCPRRIDLRDDRVRAVAQSISGADLMHARSSAV